MAKQTCSHDGCENSLPEDETKVPSGWVVAFVEEYREKTIIKYYVYICPQHTLVTAKKQSSLFEEA